ncbi:MAG: hypothetical protein AAGC76_05370 [Luteibacter sp.]|uniref:hypothetical protein n=1 Tax=Luteibacter sp. TaxID=1886636 RepID=UPI0028079A7F|nr:hypothetical protein [Luteibacter sp.]MDQ7995267.1 hypothetical protein [Luteibacter sp.]
MRAHRLLSSVAVAMLAACSQGEPAAPPAASSSAPSPTAVAAPASAPVTPAVIAAEHPFDAYQAPDHDAIRWAGLCAAVGTPVDPKVVAEQTDRTYQAAADAFAKRDALTVVQARLAQATSEGKANPYVRLPPVLTRMPDYDVDYQRYDLTPLIGKDQGMHIPEGNARIAYAPNPGLAAYAPSEADARAMEHTLSTNPLARRVDMEVFAKVTGCTLMSGSPALTVTPTRVVLANHFVDGRTTPLFTATTSP